MTAVRTSQATGEPPATDELTARAKLDLVALTSYPDRHVGSPGNHAATALFADRARELGFDVESETFECIEWEYGGARIDVGGDSFAVQVGPYSLPLDVTAPLASASTVEELESEAVRDAVVVLHGEIAQSQVMPKNFTFYNPDEHKRIITALEHYRPAAVVAATGRDPQMVGSQYPFPLFEDGDLDVPNAYMTDVDGAKLLAHVGLKAHFTIDSRRVPATAEHVVATRSGRGRGRILVSAHIDSRKGSPGALDNATGVAMLLATMELLREYRGTHTIEVVPFNGEDNYANPGELLWLARNDGRCDDIVLGINIDDAGMRGTANHVSFYNVPARVEDSVRTAMRGDSTIAEGPAWFQGDHMVLVSCARPAIAIASSDMVGFMASYAHTERDTIDLADPALVAAGARFVRRVIGELAE